MVKHERKVNARFNERSSGEMSHIVCRRGIIYFGVMIKPKQNIQTECEFSIDFVISNRVFFFNPSSYSAIGFRSRQYHKSTPI